MAFLLHNLNLCLYFLGNCFRYLVLQKRLRIAIILATSTITLWIIQASGYKTYLGGYFANCSNNYRNFQASAAKWKPWLKAHGYSSDSFQASIGLPLFYIGADKIGMEPQDPSEVHRPLAQLALAHKLPMVNVMMSRASWKRGFNIIRLFD